MSHKKVAILESGWCLRFDGVTRIVYKIADRHVYQYKFSDRYLGITDQNFKDCKQSWAQKTSFGTLQQGNNVIFFKQLHLTHLILFSQHIKLFIIKDSFLLVVSFLKNVFDMWTHMSFYPLQTEKYTSCFIFYFVKNFF